MKRVKIILGSLFLPLTMLAAGIAPAADLPGWYPKSINNTGVVTSVSRRSIVLDNGRYTLARTVQFHTPDSRKADLSRLKAGDVVAFKLLGGLTGDRSVGNKPTQTIQEMWLLPPLSKTPIDVEL